MNSQHYTCPTCGSEYEIQRHKTMMRDKDSLNCEVCGQEIESWNGGVMFTSKITKRGTMPDRKDADNKR